MPGGATNIKPFANTLAAPPKRRLGRVRFASKAPFSMDDLLRDFLAEPAKTSMSSILSWCASNRSRTTSEYSKTSFASFTPSKELVHYRIAAARILTHAAETLMANFRTGAPVTRDAVSLILATLDRIKGLLQALEQKGAEPHGNDKDLIARLEQMAAAPEVSITARAGLAGGTYAAARLHRCKRRAAMQSRPPRSRCRER